jgi:hypothetical protein
VKKMGELEIKSIAIRRIIFREEKFFISTESSLSYGGKWANCLYLHFYKEDFPGIKGPDLIEGWEENTSRFDYGKCVLSGFYWHCGVTYYSETKDIQSGRTLVKVGCDYQHLYDEMYTYQDSGEMILRGDGLGIAEEFIGLISLNKERGE